MVPVEEVKMQYFVNDSQDVMCVADAEFGTWVSGPSGQKELNADKDDIVAAILNRGFYPLKGVRLFKPFGGSKYLEGVSTYLEFQEYRKRYAQFKWMGRLEFKYEEGGFVRFRVFA